MNINALSEQQFIELFENIYEHSRWVAEQAVYARPFTSFDDVYETFKQLVETATLTQKYTLLRAHPQLGDHVQMTTASTAEQQQAGLQHLTPAQYHLLRSLNDRYYEKFQFPFIIAVKGLTVDDIIHALERRVQLNETQEFKEALAQVHLIARYRLQQLIEVGVSYA
jgi:2-oxo-4-hydroxy-4-carboxy-5-ureidoimidazoline decarboxylase